MCPGVTVYCILARHHLNKRAGYDQMDSEEDESGNVDMTGRHAFAGGFTFCVNNDKYSRNVLE